LHSQALSGNERSRKHQQSLRKEFTYGNSRRRPEGCDERYYSAARTGKAKDGAGVKLIFATLPVIPIELDDKTSQVFYDKMTNLKAEISAENLVALYNSLEQHKETQPRPKILSKKRGDLAGLPGSLARNIISTRACPLWRTDGRRLLALNSRNTGVLSSRGPDRQ